MTDAWERHAPWWQAGFTEGADAEYVEQLIPAAERHLAGARRVLDVGTGEGQVARQLAGDGRRVVGVDPTAAQIAAAARRGGGPAYGRAGAERLPFRAASFDGALACLVFEHLGALDDAVTEIARVLTPGGRFVLLLNHPLVQTPDSGWIDDRILDPPEQYWRIGPYLPEDRRAEEVAEGVRLPYVHRPLHRYVNTLVAHGLYLTRMEEPPPAPGFLARNPAYRDAAAIPRLLILVTDKLGA